MCISLFRVEICHQLVTFFNDFSVKKVDALLGPFSCKFYGMVCSVEVFLLCIIIMLNNNNNNNNDNNKVAWYRKERLHEC